MIANAVAAASVGSRAVKTRGASRALAPGRGLFALMRSKEWVLLRRDPSLMTQVAKQMMMMVPAMLVVWNLSSLTYAWLGLVLLVGQLAGALAWLAVSTEEAADLLATAPVRRSDVLSAKLQSALIPVAVIMAVPLAAAWTLGVWPGFTILAVSAGCAYATALYHVRHGQPAKRGDLMRRGDPKQLHGLVELGIGLVWIVLGAMMLVFGWWGLLAAPVLAPVLVWLVR
jgi:ABC-2 type transport system permease protein